MIIEQAKDVIRQEEGYRAKAYQDSLGIWTIGYGTNLQQLLITKELAESFLTSDVIRAYACCRRIIKDFDDLPVDVQVALINMGYNLGCDGLGGFKKMIAAVNGRDYHTAADEVMNSLYAKQVPLRAIRISRTLLSY